MPSRLLMIVVCFVACEVSGDTIDDLGSPSPAIRAAAANRLRDSYTPSPQSNWDSLVEKIRVGDLKEDVLEHLKASNPKLESGMGSGPTTWEDYRLDDVWMFLCVFQQSNGEDRLLKSSLHEQYRYVHVATPPDFTGVWTTYFINGQPSREVHFKSGRKLGLFTAFNADGSKSYTILYGPQGSGPATYYHSDGSVRRSDK